MYKVCEQMIKSNRRQSSEALYMGWVALEMHLLLETIYISQMEELRSREWKGLDLAKYPGAFCVCGCVCVCVFVCAHACVCVCVCVCVCWEHLRSALLANFKYIIQ